MSYCLDKQFFQRNQKILLWLLNTPILKYWFRYVLRIHSFDCPLKERIVSITPNFFTFGEKIILADYLVFKNGHRKLFDRNKKKHIKLARKLKIEKGLAIQRTTDFRTHNKFTKRLYFAFYPLWVVFHLWDTLIANQFNPVWNLGFDSLTVYPDAGTGSTTVDGKVGRGGSDPFETWDAIHDGVGNKSDDTSSDTFYVYIQGATTADKYNNITRSIFTLDTSDLTSGATISAADWSLYTIPTWDTDAFNQDVCMVSANPASNNDLVDADYLYTNFGTADYAPRKDLGTMQTKDNQYHTWSLNATGLAAISKTGITKFGMRLSGDVDDSITWRSGASISYCRWADYTGTNCDPKLVVTYTSATTPTVTTQAVDEITATTGDGNGNITDTGGADVTERGFVYDTTSRTDPGNTSPAASDYTYVKNETGTYSTGAFSLTITGLDNAKKYYVRAYAKNSEGYSYGDEVNFTTLKLVHRYITPKWNLNNYLSKLPTIKWNLNNYLSKLPAIKWNIFNYLKKVFTLIWEAALEIVLKITSIKWNINNTVSTTHTLKWNVMEFFVKSITTLKWNILAFSSKVITLKWSILTFLSKTPTIRWNINNFAKVTRALVWSIVAYIKKTISVLWSIRNYLLKEIILKYHIIDAWRRKDKNSTDWSYKDKNSTDWSYKTKHED